MIDISQGFIFGLLLAILVGAVLSLSPVTSWMAQVRKRRGENNGKFAKNY